jgi:ketosteroid isomerase-like protein
MSSSPASDISPEIQTVIAWHDALNNGDVERLVALSHPDVEVGGPRGTAHGAQILREWVDRTNIRLEPGRTFREANTVVAEQGAEWQSAEPGGVQRAASVFVVSDGLVTSVVRYPDLASALRAANLDASHEASHEKSPG